MAIPAVLNNFSYAFRDAKGQVATMRVKIGGATEAAVTTSAGTLKTDLAAMSNASVRCVQLSQPVVVRGTAAVYQDVEDKVMMMFQNPSTGSIHRYRVPAPLAAIFAADGETPLLTNALYNAVKVDIEAFCYGSAIDGSPLQYLGGIRERTKFQRRSNTIELDPTLSIPAE